MIPAFIIGASVGYRLGHGRGYRKGLWRGALLAAEVFGGSFWGASNLR